MKKMLIYIFSILAFNSLSAAGFENLTDNIKIGDFRYGGIVFKVDPSGQHGLVCSKSDQVRGIHWNDGQIQNNNNSENLATKVCNEYSTEEGGVIYNDWYLPSREELNLIYTSKIIIDSTAMSHSGSAFAENNELSPTEYCNSPSWDQIFNYGYKNYDYKNTVFNVRAIRAF